MKNKIKGYDNKIGEIYNTFNGKETILQGIYKNNINYQEINQFIINYLKNNDTKIIDLEKENQVMNKKLKNECSCIVEYKKYKKDIEHIEKEINDLKNKTVESYIKNSKNILDKLKDKNSKTSEKNYISIIEEYLNFIKNYINTNIVKDFHMDPDFCHECNNSSEIKINKEGLSYCSNCFHEKEITTNVPFYKDLDIQDNNYSKKCIKVEDNFYKTISRIQGKQNMIPDKILEDIENYLNRNTNITTSDIKNMPLNKHNKKEGTSREMLLNALKETGNESKYKDFNLIASMIWGWKLPDLSSYEELIIQDYEKCQRFYDEIKKNGKKTGLKSDIRLFLHLRALNIDIDQEHFRFVGTKEILYAQFTMFNEMRMMAELNTIEYPFHI